MDLSNFDWGWMGEEGPKNHNVKNFTTGEWGIGTFGEFHKKLMKNFVK